MGFPWLRKGSGSRSAAVHGLDSIVFTAFPNLNDSIKSRSTDLELFPFMPKLGFFQGAVKGPVLHQREQIGIFMDILRERVWSFVSGPFYWQLKHFQEPGGFSPSHKLSLNHPALLELLSPVNPSPSQQLQVLSR